MKKFFLFLCLMFPLLCWNHSPLTAAYAAQFKDVGENSPYAKAVEWAVAYPSEDDSITKGRDATHFAPNEECSRANVLTFLWRYLEKPTANGLVSYSDREFQSHPYYEPAAVWADQNGIEKGQSVSGKRYFFPNNGCTRLEALTYLWLLEGRPTDLSYYDKADQFVDVKDRTPHERQAVGWAVSMRITNGISETEFNPHAFCTRGQIVTFFFRYHNNVRNNQR